MNNHRIWQTASDYPRRNIMTSLLWVSALTFPTGSLALMAQPWPGALVFSIGVLSVLVTLGYYAFWSRTDPDRLQTEDYRIQRDAISKVSQPLEIISSGPNSNDIKKIAGGEL